MLTGESIRQLNCGDVLHRGRCRSYEEVRHGDWRPTRYYVLYVERETDNWLVAVTHEQTFAVSHIIASEASQWHLAATCPAFKRGYHGKQ